MSCRELVKIVVTEGTLRARDHGHLSECPDCVVYVESVEVTVRSLGHLPAPPADPAVRERLLAVFRERRG